MLIDDCVSFPRSRIPILYIYNFLCFCYSNVNFILTFYVVLYYTACISVKGYTHNKEQNKARVHCMHYTFFYFKLFNVISHSFDWYRLLSHKSNYEYCIALILSLSLCLYFHYNYFMFVCVLFGYGCAWDFLMNISYRLGRMWVATTTMH